MGRSAVEMSRRLEPDIVVMDVSMPELNGFEATRQILAKQPRIEVLALSMHESQQMVNEVLDAGARGYVLKSDAGSDLVAAVEALRRASLFLFRASRSGGEKPRAIGEQAQPPAAQGAGSAHDTGAGDSSTATPRAARTSWWLRDLESASRTAETQQGQNHAQAQGGLRGRCCPGTRSGMG